MKGNLIEPIVFDRTRSSARAIGPNDIIPAGAIERARAVVENRQRRAQSFADANEIFGEPAWDILLDLFVGHGEGRRMTIASCCSAADIPPSTMLRWISIMKTRALIYCRLDWDDACRSAVGLTDRGLASMLHALRDRPVSRGGRDLE